MRKCVFADAARFTRHAPADRWYVDETYVKGLCVAFADQGSTG
jgi:hypothetical protein